MGVEVEVLNVWMSHFHCDVCSGTVHMSQLLKALVLLVVDPGITAPHRPSTSEWTCWLL